MKNLPIKIMWYGFDLENGKAKPPQIAQSDADILNGLSLGEFYVCAADEDPCIFIRTNQDNIVAITRYGSGGTASSVSVNGSVYNSVDGLVTLPNYPTSLPASDVYSWAKQANKPTYAWDEITNKPSWIGSTKPSYAWDEISSKPTTFTPSAHSHAWSDIVSGKPTTLSGYGITDMNSYAPTLTGGGASGTWPINITGNSKSVVNGSSSMFFETVPDSTWATFSNIYGNIQLGPANSYAAHIYTSMDRFYFNKPILINGVNTALITDNVASATKLQTARTIFGQPFDGTQNVSGNLSDVEHIYTHGYLYSNITGNTLSVLDYYADGSLALAYGLAGAGLDTHIHGAHIKLRAPVIADGIGYYAGSLSSGESINAGIGLGITNTSATSGYGLSLYGGAVTGKPTYGIMFSGTATYGTHGGVTGGWATYFTMSNDTDRGWIFQCGITNVASIDGNGNMLLNGLLTSTLGIKSPSYTTGIPGNGYSIWKDSNNLWTAEFDNLLIRNQMKVTELLIAKQRAVNGELIVSQACGRIKTVELVDNDYHITLEDDNSFSAGDLLKCQTFSTTFGVKYYLVEVYEVSNNTIIIPDLSFNGQSTPAVGDEISSVGNTWDTTKQSFMSFSVNSNAPRISVYNGVNSISLTGKEKVRIGELSGIDDNSFLGGSPNGYGIYTNNGFFSNCFTSGVVSASVSINPFIYPTNPSGGILNIGLSNSSFWNLIDVNGGTTVYIPADGNLSAMDGMQCILYYGNESASAQDIIIRTTATGTAAMFVNKYSGTSPATAVSIAHGKMLKLRFVKTTRGVNDHLYRWYIENPEDCLVVSTVVP